MRSYDEKTSQTTIDTTDMFKNLEFIAEVQDNHFLEIMKKLEKKINKWRKKRKEKIFNEGIEQNKNYLIN